MNAIRGAALIVAIVIAIVGSFIGGWSMGWDRGYNEGKDYEQKIMKKNLVLMEKMGVCEWAEYMAEQIGCKGK